MKKFKVIGSAMTIYTGDEEYYNARVTSGGYSPKGGYCSILIYGAEEEMSFRFDDPKVYDAIVSAYLSGETIGLVLNARDLMQERFRIEIDQIPIEVEIVDCGANGEEIEGVWDRLKNMKFQGR